MIFKFKSYFYSAKYIYFYPLNSNLTANSIPLIFDYQDGKYGYNTSSSRGADTFHPFSSGLHHTILTSSGTYANSYTFDDTPKLIAIKSQWASISSGYSLIIDGMVIFQSASDIESLSYDSATKTLSWTNNHSYVTDLYWIGESDYYESLVPTMTSNTTPSGLAFASTEYTPAWKCMNGVETQVSTNNSSLAFGSCYIGYKFTTAKKVVKVRAKLYSEASTYKGAGTLTIQASNDGITYTSIGTISHSITGQNCTGNISEANQGYYLYYRVIGATNSSSQAGGDFLGLTVLQLYGIS